MRDVKDFERWQREYPLDTFNSLRLSLMAKSKSHPCQHPFTAARKTADPHVFKCAKCGGTFKL